MKVTIAIRNYNYEKYIYKAVASAVNQSYGNLEIIVVDDGSTDGSREIVAQFEPAVRLIAQPNLGQINAFNRCFAESTGELILFLDADDYLFPDAIKKVVSLWDASTVKGQFELQVIDGNGYRLGRKFCNFPSGYDSEKIAADFELYGSYIWPVTTGNLYARNFLSVLLPLSVKNGPDGILNTLAPLYGKIVTVDEILGSYRLHDENQTRFGVSEKNIGERFTRQVNRRLFELGVLEEHARRLGRTISAAETIKEEPIFNNFKLMAKRLGKDYIGSSMDTAYGLYRNGIHLALRNRSPAKAKIIQIIWLTCLAFSPVKIARLLVNLRFNRGAIRNKWRGYFISR